MRQLITLFFILTVSIFAQANDFAVVVGAQTNSADKSNSASTYTVSGKTGLHAGVLGFMDLTGALAFRSGFVYTQRTYTYESSCTAGSCSNDVKLAYFDIPATLMYKFADYAGVFGGAVLAMNASKDCSPNCVADGVKSSMVGFQFGASFKFAPQIGAQFYYEMFPDVIQEVTTLGVSSGIKSGKSVVASLMFTFE